MPPIAITISIEGDPEGSIEALRQLAGMGASGTPISFAAQTPTGNGEDGFDGSAPAADVEIPARLPIRYRALWDNHAGGPTVSQPLPELSWPAQWDPDLSNELVRNMSEGARRLVAVLAGSGADGMTREALTTELGIETDTIRTTQVSIGHALRRVQRANGNIRLPRPVEFHKRIDTYMLNPGFRAAIQERE